MAKTSKSENVPEVQETAPVTAPTPTPREQAWNRLIEKYKAQSPKIFEARVAAGEDFSKIPASFQGVFKIENGKEIIY